MIYKLWKEDPLQPELGYTYVGEYSTEDAAHVMASELGLTDYRIELEILGGSTIVFEI